MSKQFSRGRTPNADRPAGARNKVLRAKNERKAREAVERKVAHELTTPEDQIAYLDRKLGVGVGAQKERERLLKLVLTGHGRKTFSAINALGGSTKEEVKVKAREVCAEQDKAAKASAKAHNEAIAV